MKFAILLALPLYAQHAIPGAATGQVLVTSQFRVPSTYQAALVKLSTYYEDQVGRKLAVAFPEIGPRQHYSVWHDIWVSFGPEDSPVTVTMKRPADSITNRLVRNWMLDFAGRLGAEVPIQYKDLPAPAVSEADIYATPKDLASIFKSIPSMKSVATWEHLGIAVSPSPFLSLAMDSVGLHGVHHVVLTAENAAALRQLTTAMNQGLLRPGICGVYSELAEVEADVSTEVETNTSLIGTHTAGTIFTPEITRKHEEDIVRAKPEIKKRITDATGYFDVKFRPDKAYARVTITWIQLQNFTRETGAFEGERVLGRTPITGARVPGPGAAPLNARSKLDPLQPGAYRIRLEGDNAQIDQRTFWFDGKKFQEL
jgi:hypothetical protein